MHIIEIEDLLTQARKETAELILNELLKALKYTFGINGKPLLVLDADFASNIAKQYKITYKCDLY